MRREQFEALVVKLYGLREESLRADDSVALGDDEVRTGVRGVELQARHHCVRCFFLLFEFEVVHPLPVEPFGTFRFQFQLGLDLFERCEVLRLVFLLRLGQVELAFSQVRVDPYAVF